MAWTDSLYSSGLRSSDETGNSGRSCHEAPEPSFAQNSSKLFFQRAGSNPTSRARMWTMDRIEAIRTNQSPPRGNYINHIAAEALARNVRSNGYR